MNNKKKIKNMNIYKKIILTVILIFTILSTTFVLKVNAQEMKGTELGYVGGNPNLLCDNESGYLPYGPGAADTPVVSAPGEPIDGSSFEHNPEYVDRLISSKTSYNVESSGSYNTTTSIADFSGGSPVQADPTRTWILANVGILDTVTVQNAWWGHGNNLMAQANEFTTYIGRVSSGVGSPSGFDIKYEPKWIEQEKVISTYNQIDNTFLVGPFAIDYVRSGVGDDATFFAGIKEMTLYGDAGQVINGWEFLFPNGTKVGDFPDEKQQFYFKIPKQDWLTKITNIKVDFKYKNAEGSYTELTGKYMTASYEKRVTTHTETYHDVYEPGDTVDVTKYECKYYRTGSTEHDAQAVSRRLSRKLLG